MTSNPSLNEIIAQGALIWKESEIHELIMNKIKQVHGFMEDLSCDLGHCSAWRVHTLSLDDLKLIIDRGRHDEIVFLIDQYGKSTPPEHWRSGCTGCGFAAKQTTEHILPDEIQEMIAKRGDHSEISSFCKYHGFGYAGQKVILDRGNHEEIMLYIDRHGFLPELQPMLFTRKMFDEIQLHTLRHGWSVEIWNSILDEMIKESRLELFYEIVLLHELPVESQRYMIKKVASEEFRAYVDRYGLWNDVHGDLIRFRSHDDIGYYIDKHRFLSSIGERFLANSEYKDLKFFYIRNKVENNSTNIISFLHALLKEVPLDYELLTACFVKPSVSTPLCWETEEDFNLIKHGSHEQVMHRIDKGMLSNRALTALFFRNNADEFNAYIDKWFRS